MNDSGTCGTGGVSRVGTAVVPAPLEVDGRAGEGLRNVRSVRDAELLRRCGILIFPLERPRGEFEAWRLIIRFV